MLRVALNKTLSCLIHTPSLWIPGLYAGAILSLVIWLEFSGEVFLAGKIAMLALIASPFLVGMTNYALETGTKAGRELLSAGLKSYFPIILPCVMLGGIILLMILLFSVPLSIMGFGDSLYTLSGLFLGISIPALIFSIYIDNVAVSEKKKIFEILKRSMELVSLNFFGAVGYLFVSGLVILGVGFLGAVLWGMVLADKFTQFMGMNITMQQETFSHYTLTDWQTLIGPEGIAVTAIVFGLVSCIIVPFLLVFKYQCYKEVSHHTPPVFGEYDEKGRWYKY